MRLVPLPPLDYSHNRGVVPAGAVLRRCPVLVQLGRDSAIAEPAPPPIKDPFDDFKFCRNRDHATAVAVHPETQRRV